MKAEKLQNITLIGNNIGPDIFLSLTKASWPKITKVNFRNNSLKKKQIKLETKDAII